MVAGAAEMARAADGPIDGLINNAGVPGSASRRVTTDGRIVNLASATHEMTRPDLPDLELEQDYSAVRAYARSKLAIVMYTRWLAGRLTERDVTAVSLSPGVINTDLLHAIFGSIGGSLGRGARNVIGALTAEVSGGEYFDDGRLVDPSAEAQRDDLRDELMAGHLRRTQSVPAAGLTRQ